MFQFCYCIPWDSSQGSLQQRVRGIGLAIAASRTETASGTMLTQIGQTIHEGNLQIIQLRSCAYEDRNSKRPTNPLKLFMG